MVRNLFRFVRGVESVVRAPFVTGKEGMDDGPKWSAAMRGRARAASARRGVASLLVAQLGAAALALVASQAHAQTDRVHYIPPFFARVDLGAHYILVSTLETTPFDVTVTDGAGTLVHTFTGLTRALPQSFELPGTGYGQIGVLSDTELNTITTQGLILTAEAPFTANVRHKTSEQGLSLTSKGKFGLGTDFRSGHIISNDTDVASSKSHFVSVMATEDDTSVLFSDVEVGLTFFGGAGNPFSSTVTLDAGESYVIGYKFDDPTSNLLANPNDVNGTRVTSDKPVVFNTGSWQGGNAEGNRKDMDADQAVSVERLGTSFVVIEGDATTRAALLERPGVVAAYDSTEIRAGGALLATIDAGEYFYIPSSSYSANRNMYIETSRPAFLYQSTSANDSNGMGMSFIPPLRCNGSTEVVVPEANLLGDSAVGIVARAGATVSVNGSALPGPGLSVPGTADWVTYNYDVPVTVDTVDIVSTNVINVSLVTKAGDRGASGYFTGFADSPTIVASAMGTDLCTTSPITLEAEGTLGFASFRWYRDGVLIAGATTSIYSAALPGSYTVEGVFFDDGSEACAGESSSQSPPVVLSAANCICGDGIETMFEQCDDGNLDADDGCSPTCLDEYCGDSIENNATEECDDGNTVDTDACTNACTIAVCGDGVVRTGIEQCDDGNTVDTDGCLNICQIAVCGDGVVRTGTEECDDGNTVDTDLCTNACTNAECGDGITGPGEECDDGNLVDTDVCTNACTTAECGDGVTGPGEECDDGNLVDTDACTNGCTNAECGDGITGPGEECDDGNLVDTDACTNGCTNAGCGDGITGPGEECDDGNLVDTDVCTNACTDAECGDSVTGPGEECDDGNTVNNDACTNACANAECGDSITGPGEECDDGNTVAGDGCSPTCQLVACGDGTAEQDEACDDGNLNSGDGCDASCAVEPCWDCVGTAPSVCAQDNAEACDDGDACTLVDTCSAGVCSGSGSVLIPAACRWVMVGGDPGPKPVRARTRANVETVGAICGDEVFLGEHSLTTGEVVAGIVSGSAVRVGLDALMDGDVITGGGTVRGKPGGSLLPGTVLDVIAGGVVVPKDASTDYDTTGTHASVADCVDAQAGIEAGAALLDALPSTANLGNVTLATNGSLTIAPGSPIGVTAGALNVIDIGRFKSGDHVTVTLDGGGDPETRYVLRVGKKFDLRFDGTVDLVNGQVAGNVILYGKTLCRFGKDVEGGGTVICPNGKLLLREQSTWEGALLGGYRRVEMRGNGVLTHAPLLIAP